MSTRPEPTSDDTTTNGTHANDSTSRPRTDTTTTDFSTTSTKTIASTTATTTESAANTTASTPPHRDGAPTPHGDVPWTQRCTQQFESTDTTRLSNCTDDENAAMHDGI